MCDRVWGRRVASAIMMLVAAACSTGDRTLFVVNATGEPGLVVLLDGKPVTGKLAVASGSLQAGGMLRVPVVPGVHALEARDSAGKVLEQQTLHMGKKSFGFLFAPAHRANSCFEVRTLAFGNYRGSTAPVPLHAGSTLWEMDHFIDRWFEDSPDKVVVSKGQTGSHERSVVMVPCPQMK